MDVRKLSLQVYHGFLVKEKTNIFACEVLCCGSEKNKERLWSDCCIVISHLKQLNCSRNFI